MFEHAYQIFFTNRSFAGEREHTAKDEVSPLVGPCALDGREVTTTEGLMQNGKPNKLQQAFIDEEAAQCGYCISGMVMRAQALLNTKPKPNEEEIRNYMRPNLCRCGTHAAILRAIRRAAVA